VNNHIQSLKVCLKSILSWLKYSFFSRGLFFIGAPCMFIQQEAMMAHYGLCSASKWIAGGGEHAKISQKMAQLELLQARCDRRVPKY